MMAAAAVLSVLSLTYFAAPAFAQRGVGVNDGSGNPIRPGLADTLERIAGAAADMIPTFVKTVEEPLGPYFDFLAWYLAWLIMLMFMLKVFRGAAQNDPEDIFWAFARVGVCFALLSYCGDTNGDGVRGDLVNRLGRIGNSVAYGDPCGDGCRSFLQRQVHEKQLQFSNSYTRFLEGHFMYRVDNEDRLVQYPDEENVGFQMLAAMYSGTYSPQQLADKFNPSGWSMGWLFQFLNFGRGLVEFGDLFLLILNGFLVASIRLAAPFMTAVAIDREHAKRISVPYAWGVVIVTLVMPSVSQVIRFFAYTVANIPLGFGGGANPYFKFDPSTAKVVALGNPEYSILIAALVMIICGLSMFASPYISYKLGQGAVLEAVTGVVSGWMGAIVSTGVSTASVAMGAAISNQAANVSANAGARAEGVTANSALEASNRNAAGALSNQIALSRSSQQAEVGNARATEWASAQRAIAQQEKLEAEQVAGVQAGDMERDTKLANQLATSTVGLDDSFRNDFGVLNMATSSIDDLGRGLGFRSTRNVDNVTDGVGAIPGTEQPFRGLGEGGRVAPTVSGGAYGARRDYGQHTGVDDNNFRAGEAVGVAAAGRVSFARATEGAGGVVAVDHGGGRQSVYKHLDPESIKGVKEGQQVERGDFIGRVATAERAGTSAQGAHLHFEAGMAAGKGKGGVPRTSGDPNSAEFSDLRAINLSTSTVSGGRRGAYQAPENVRSFLDSAGGDISKLPHTKRDQYLAMTNATREAMTSGAADRHKSGATIEAGRAYTSREIEIGSRDAHVREGIAVTAGGQRESAARHLYRETRAANEITYRGQAGNPNAQPGTPEYQGAIEIRRVAAVEAARLNAMAQVVSGLGSTIASQTQSVFQQFNRY